MIACIANKIFAQGEDKSCAYAFIFSKKYLHLPFCSKNSVIIQPNLKLCEQRNCNVLSMGCNRNSTNITLLIEDQPCVFSFEAEHTAA